MKKTHTLIIVIIFLVVNISAQTPTLSWAKGYIGTTTNTNARGCAVDASGNVYTCSRLNSGIQDFDPGAGVFNINVTGTSANVICKLDPSGNFIWAKRFGFNDIEAYSIALDVSGNVYMIGQFSNIVDFDPGSGVFNLNSGSGGSGFCVKLDPSGNFVWAKNFGPNFNSRPNNLSCDNAGNIVIVGDYSSAGDFDPGSGVFNLTPASGSQSGFVLKLDASGNFVWAKQFTGIGSAFPTACATDASGNIFIGGGCNSVDLDPGSGTVIFPTGGLFICELDVNGIFVLAKQFVGSGDMIGLKIDGLGNIYSLSWTGATFADFDPGAGIVNLSTYVITKLDPLGNYIWAKNTGGQVNSWIYNCLAIDNNGNASAVGYFSGGPLDLDPGPGTFNVSSVGYSIFILNLDAAGNFISGGKIGNNSADCSIAARNGSIYITTDFTGTADYDPSAGTFNLVAGTSSGFAVAKYNLCTLAPSTPPSITGSATICQGSTNTYSVTAVSGATSYTWTLPGGWTGTSTTNSINATASATSGNITVTANNACGNSSAQTLAITVNPLPATPGTISGTATICSGTTNTYSITAVGGATSYTWTLPGGWTGTSTTNSINATASATSGNITVTANNACGSGSAQTLAVTVNTTPATPGTISGTATICSGSTNTYSITAVAGATSYTWALPGGWTGTSTTNSINATASATSGNITVTANNTCGNSSVQTLAVTVNSTPATPGTISGTATICSGSTNTYSITAVAGATSYTWTLPGGWTGTSTTNSINATASSTSGNITVTANNTCGNSSVQTLAVTVNTIPATPGTISGTATICSGSTNTYSITAVAGATSYTWTLPGGWTGTSTTNSINATASATSGNITVTANNTCGNSAVQTLAITVNSIPATPGTISGTATICSGTSNTYSITAVAGATSYTWTLPGGWTGTSTTNSINATASATSGNITVTANNTCGNSAVQTLAVTVNTIPATPGTISGTATICSGTTNTYSITAVAGATSYTWTLPGGWTGTSTTNSINATASTTSGNITVTANNTCGNSAVQTLAITVNTIPTTPGTISGTATICSGTSNTYSITAVAGATSYTWTLPAGWAGSSTTNSINSISNSTSGNITVTANNACGNSSVQTLAVTVNSTPATPGTISGTATICSGTMNTYSITAVADATSYNWTLPGGWTGTSTTNSINTTASATSGNITVTASNTCGTSLAQTFAVTVNTTPATPGTISGNASICVGSSNTYSITAVAGATSYTWILPSGWTGTSTTNSISTTSSGTSGNVILVANNTCGTSSAQTLAVSVNPLPTVTYSQSPSLVCVNNTSVPLTVVTPTGGVFSGTAVTGSTFNAAAAGLGTYTITYTYTDVNSCVNSDTSSIVVDACLSVEQIANNREVIVYPNPTNSVVYVKTFAVSSSGVENKAQLNVINILGETVYSTEVKSENTAIDVSDFQNGIYFIQVQVENKIVTKKVIKN